MQHSDAEIPQQETAVIADTAEPVGLLVTAPWVKGNCGNPGVVTLASGNDSTFGEGPDSDQIILSSGYYVLAIRGPADANQTAVVTAEDVQDPNSGLARYSDKSRYASPTLLSGSP